MLRFNSASCSPVSFDTAYGGKEDTSADKLDFNVSYMLYSASDGVAVGSWLGNAPLLWSVVLLSGDCCERFRSWRYEFNV